MALFTGTVHLSKRHLRIVSTNQRPFPAEKAFEECVKLETMVQLLQSAAFGEVDVEQGLTAFHVSLRRPSSVLHQKFFDAQSMQAEWVDPAPG